MKLSAVLGLFMVSLAGFSQAARAETGATRFGISGPLMLVEGTALYGGNVSLLHSVSEQVEVGLETGYFTRSESAGFLSVSVSVIPVLPTVLYNFDVNSTSITPFVGLGLGVGIASASVNVGGLSGSASEANFEGLTHLGMKIGESKNFFVDMKAGIINSSFAFVPSVGWFF